MSTKLVACTDFRQLAAEQAGAASRAQAHRPELWQRGKSIVNCTAAQFQELHQRIPQSAAMLSEEQTWLREALFAGWSGGGLKDTWQDLLAAIETLVNEAGTAHRYIMAYGPELPQDRDMAEILAMLVEIVTFLKKGGAFGMKTKLTRRP